MRAVVLDSLPLGLLTQRPGVRNADACRAWLSAKLNQGMRVFVPEIIDYEIRRELIRCGKTAGLQRLNHFVSYSAITFIPITSSAMKLAAQFWAQARRQGKPTADPHALDVDVILAAQVIDAGLDASAVIVATSNVAHLSHFLPADVWTNI